MSQYLMALETTSPPGQPPTSEETTTPSPPPSCRGWGSSRTTSSGNYWTGFDKSKIKSSRLNIISKERILNIMSVRLRPISTIYLALNSQFYYSGFLPSAQAIDSWR